MKDFAFAAQSRSGLPKHGRSSYALVAALHILLIAFLVHVRTQPKRVGSAGSPFASMTAYVPGPASASPGAAASKPIAPGKPAPATKVARAASNENDAGGQTSAAAGQGGSGPVRFGSGGSLTLLKKVTPIYPTLMQSARVAGQVVLDAIIHPDGTIGDITILRATNDAFAQSATAAVKQWRYTAPGFEGILTVTVNFTLPN